MGKLAMPPEDGQAPDEPVVVGPVVGRVSGGARAGAASVGRLVHRLVQFALTLVLVAGLGVAALAVRLGQGPLDVTWLAQRALVRFGSASGAAVEQVTVQWDGLRAGGERAVELRLGGLEMKDESGASVASAKAVAVAVSAGALAHLRFAPETIDVSGVRLSLQRQADGGVGLAGGTAPSSGASPDLAGLLGRLQRVQVHDASASVDDRQLGLVWSVPALDVDLRRTAAGGAAGLAAAVVAAGAERLPLELRLVIQPEAGGLMAAFSSGRLNPAHLAGLAPALAPLSALDATAGVSGSVVLDAGFGLKTASLKLGVDAGTVHIGEGVMPIRALDVSAEATARHLDLHVDRLVLQARDEAQPTNVRVGIVADRAAGKVDARVVVDLDQVLFTDLPALWPVGVGGPGTRPWITKNITAGLAHDAHVEVTLSAPEDFSDATVTAISGGLEGSDVTGHWLRPVPPIEHGAVKVVFVDPDTLDVLISSGRQAESKLALHPSKVRLTGLAAHDQFIAIEADIFGPFADLLALLRHPRIKLLDRRPIPLNNPSGAVTGLLTVNFPLKNSLDIDNVALHARGKLVGGHIGGIAAGRDIDRAQFDYDVTNDGLVIKGAAAVANIATQLRIDMDFRTGPPSQVMEKVVATGLLTPRDLQAQGLDVTGVLIGTVPVQLDYLERRDTTAEVAVKADLVHAGIDAGRAGWRKPAGEPGSADALVRLKAGKLVGVERVRVEAPGLSVLASADTAGGQPNTVRIQKLVVGTTTDVTGLLVLPEREGQPYGVTLAGPSLDVSAELDRPSKPVKPGPPSKTLAFKLDLKLGRLVTSADRSVTNVVARVENDGTITTSARVTATSGTGPVVVEVVPERGGRRLSAEAQDAGAVLRAAGSLQTLSGGRLVVRGRYDDTDAAHPLRGTAQLDDFRIRDAPVIGRILQAMSLYGLIDVARGPGLGFTRMVAPFTFRRDVLTLQDARAYSSSLGLTLKGTVDLDRRALELDGTVIPAYFFNSLLGRVPLVGKLFSPETGGGLFAATFAVHGSIDNPSFVVNPLAALTPGFLRGFFDIFDTDGAPKAGPAGPEAQR